MNIGQSQPHDPTENWLRQTLGNYQPEAPADAWQRLAPHLPQRQRRRPFAFWLSGAAVSVAAGVALFWCLNHVEAPLISVEKTPTVAHVWPDLSSEGFGENKAAAALENPVPPTAMSFSKTEFLKNNSPTAGVNFSKSKPLAATSAASFSGKNGLQTEINLPKNSTATSPVEPDFSKKTTSAAPAYLGKPAPPRTENPLEKRLGKILASLVLAEKPLSDFQFPAVPVWSKKAKVPRFWLGMEAMPSLFMPKNMGGMSVGLAFPEMHLRPGRGWQAGVSLTAEPLRNWRVALGIQHLRQTREAMHSATLRLMDGVCLNPHDTGLKEYEFRYAVTSGGEQSDLTLRLQQQAIGLTMPNDEPFTLEMKTVHRSAAWRIPLTVERRFGTGKWRGFVRGGAVVDFSEKTQTEVTHFTEVCQDLCFQGGHIPAIQTSRANKTALGWQLGAGIERQISRRAALRFEPFIVGQKGPLQCGLNFDVLFSN